MASIEEVWGNLAEDEAGAQEGTRGTGAQGRAVGRGGGRGWEEGHRRRRQFQGQVQKARHAHGNY